MYEICFYKMPTFTPNSCLSYLGFFISDEVVLLKEPTNLLLIGRRGSNKYFVYNFNSFLSWYKIFTQSSYYKKNRILPYYTFLTKKCDFQMTLVDVNAL